MLKPCPWRFGVQTLTMDVWDFKPYNEIFYFIKNSTQIRNNFSNVWIYKKNLIYAKMVKVL